MGFSAKRPTFLLLASPHASLFAFFLIVAAAAVAEAGDKDAEKAAAGHFHKGKALVQEGKYDEAVAELEASYELNPLPIVIYNLAVIFDKQGHPDKAIDHYKRYLAESEDLPEETKAKVTIRIEKLRKKVAVLKLSVNEDGAQVTLDGRVVAVTPAPELYLSLGVHHLEIRKEGFTPVLDEVKVISLDTIKLSFKLEPAPGVVEVQEGGSGAGASPPAVEKPVPPTEEDAGSGKKGGHKKIRSKAPFIALMSVGGGLCIVAMFTGLISLSDTYSIGNEEQKMSADTKEKLRLSTYIMLGVAGAFLLSGAVVGGLTQFGQKKEAKAMVVPAPVPDGMGMGLVVIY